METRYFWLNQYKLLINLDYIKSINFDFDLKDTERAVVTLVGKDGDDIYEVYDGDDIKDLEQLAMVLSSVSLSDLKIDYEDRLVYTRDCEEVEAQIKTDLEIRKKELDSLFDINEDKPEPTE